MHIEVFRFKGLCIVTLENNGITTVLKKMRSALKATKYAKRIGESNGFPVYNGLQ